MFPTIVAVTISQEKQCSYWARTELLLSSYWALTELLLGPPKVGHMNKERMRFPEKNNERQRPKWLEACSTLRLSAHVSRRRCEEKIEFILPLSDSIHGINKRENEKEKFEGHPIPQSQCWRRRGVLFTRRVPNIEIEGKGEEKQDELKRSGNRCKPKDKIRISSRRRIILFPFIYPKDGMKYSTIQNLNQSKAMF